MQRLPRPARTRREGTVSKPVSPPVSCELTPSASDYVSVSRGVSAVLTPRAHAGSCQLTASANGLLTHMLRGSGRCWLGANTAMAYSVSPNSFRHRAPIPSHPPLGVSAVFFQEILMSSNPRSRSPLSLVEDTVRQMCQPPRRFTIEPAELGLTGQQPSVSVVALRELLAHPNTQLEVKNRVWAAVVTRAQHDLPGGWPRSGSRCPDCAPWSPSLAVGTTASGRTSRRKSSPASSERSPGPAPPPSNGFPRWCAPPGTPVWPGYASTDSPRRLSPTPTTPTPWWGPARRGRRGIRI